MFSAPHAVEQPTLFTAPTPQPPVAAPTLRTPAVASPFSRPGRTAPTPPPTPEQEAILDAYFTGQHCTVEALAGTGKTTSLRQIAAAQPNRPGAYLAYNAAIADAAKGKFPPRVVTGTAHSFAFGAIGRQYAHRLPSRTKGGTSSQRLPAYEVARVLDLADVRVGGRHFTAAALARLAEATVKKFCESADLALDGAHVPTIPGVDGKEQAAELAALVVPAAETMWADIRHPDGRLWFTHDHYLKMWQLSGPVLPVDYVLFDEAQDANPVIAAIVAAQEHAQLVYVGDRNQQLYAWRGAVDAMGNFDGLRLPLTKSFRFGPAIADEANNWLTLLGTRLRIVGHDPIRSRVGYLDSPADAVLCRTNGGAVGAVMEAQAAGRKVSLVGDGKDIKRFAFAARSLMAGKGCDLPELAAFKTWRALVEYVEEEESGRDLAVLVKLVQRYSPGTLIDVVNELVPAKKADVIVSTAHRAKGLEWPSVRIAGDFTAPADGERPERAELMLAYVAVTRAQRGLDRGSLDWPHRGRLDDTGIWFTHRTDLED